MAKSKLLTDTQYAALKAKESEYRISDIAGLYLKVGIAGKKSWQLRLKNTAGKWTWLGLGSYPTISVKEARSLAIKYQNGELNLKTKNEKILEAKQQENLLFGNLLIKWMNTKRGVWTEQTFKKEYQSIEKHILPVFGDRLFKDIPASEWKEFFREKQLGETVK
ncbi:Arm DNA-binding domain-containing protein [Acinetobacter towneri]|uniref:Arm DNA-binding domain-containing protein n=1 Tax=Acinetobacter towneri TaxID=202956 RepID=UPI002B1BD227|nr:Arm DNA-binding domain-containing protein [Acinetobacter towneri]